MSVQLPPSPPPSTPTVPSRQATSAFPTKLGPSAAANQSWIEPLPSSDSPERSPARPPPPPEFVKAVAGPARPGHSLAARAGLGGPGQDRAKARRTNENAATRPANLLRFAGLALATPDPSSPRSSSESERTPSGSAVKRVMFDPNPLKSASATPRHSQFLQFTKPRAQLYSAETSKVALEKVTDPISPPSSSSRSLSFSTRPASLAAQPPPRLRRTRHSSATSDGSTDSDGEAEAVQSLLISTLAQQPVAGSSTEHLLQSDRSSSPLRPLPLTPFALKVPAGPKSILKLTAHKIQNALNVCEGSKHNMRTKHQLSFDEQLRGFDFAALATAAAASTTTSGLAQPTRDPASGPSSSATTNGHAGLHTGPSGPSGGAGDEGGGGPSSNRIPPATACPTSDEHCSALIGPLNTLRASLELHAQLESDVLIASAFPRSIESQPASPADPFTGWSTVGVTLAEVEQAYVELTTALVRLPTTLKFAARTLAPLNQHAAVLRRCLLREMTNLTTGPKATVVTDVFGSGRKQGLSGDQMRRQRDEIAAAQTAIKSFAALTRHEAACAVFSVADINELLGSLLSLPTSSALAGLARKEVLPFVSFFIATQRLPAAVLAPFFTKLVNAVKEMLAVFDSKGRHDRNNMNEALAAIAQLFATQPDRMLRCWREWLAPTLDGVWDGPKKAVNVRNRALTTLGAVAQALIASPSSADPAEAAEARATRDARNKEIALAMIDSLHGLVPNDRIYNRDPIARDATDPATRMTLLAEQLVPFIPVAVDDPRLKPDDTPWLAIVDLLALLPVLMEQRFRRLQQRGIRPWISLFSAALARPIPHVRTLAVLAWPHLLYGFLRVPPDTGPPEGRAEADPGRVAWIFREDGKPFGLLNNVFSADNKKSWLAPSGQSTPTGKVRTKALALPLVHTLVSSIYGISVLVQNGQVAGVGGPSAAQLGALTQVWNRLVVLHLVPALRATYGDVRGLAWAALTAIVQPPTLETSQAKLERLVNPVFLDGSVLATKVPMGQTLLAARALSSTVVPGEIPGWTTKWTVPNVARVLELVDELIGADPAACVAAEASIVTFWSSLMAAVNVERHTPEGLAATEVVAEWLLNKTLSDVVSLYVLGSTLSAVTIKVLGRAITSPAPNATEARATTLSRATFESPFAFKTEHELAFSPGAGQLLDAVHSTPAGWRVLDLATAAFDAHVVSSKQFVPVRAKLAALWANLLAVPELADAHLSEVRFQSVVKLTNIYLRSNEAAKVDGPWTALASALAKVMFGIDSTGARKRREFVAALLEPPSAAAADVRLMTYLLLGGSAVGLTKRGRSSLLELATNAAHLLFCAPQSDWVDVLGRMIAAAGVLDVPLYAAFLANIEDVATPTSTDLAKFAPLLGPTLAKAIEALERESGAGSMSAETVSQASRMGREPRARAALGAFRDCYAKVWDTSKEPLDIPVSLVDLLVAVRRSTVGLTVKDLVETQPQPEPEAVPTPMSEPVPGQRVRTPVTVNLTAMKGLRPRTSACEADVSVRQARAEFPAVLSSSTSPDQSDTLLPEPSASLAIPSAAEAEETTQVADEADLSTFLEDTPREFDRERTRSELAGTATAVAEELTEEPRTSTSIQELLDLDSGDRMTLLTKKKRKRGTPLTVPTQPDPVTPEQPALPTESPAVVAAQPAGAITSPNTTGKVLRELESTQSTTTTASSVRAGTGASPTKKPRMTAWVEVPAPVRKETPVPKPDGLRQVPTPVRVLSPTAARSAALPVILPAGEQGEKPRKRKAKDDPAPMGATEGSAKPKRRRTRSSAALKARSEAGQSDSEDSLRPAPPPASSPEPVHTPRVVRKPFKRKAVKQAREEAKRQAELDRSPSVVPPTQSESSRASSPAPLALAPSPSHEAEELVRRLLGMSADVAANALSVVGGSSGVQKFLHVAKRAGEWFGAAVSPGASAAGMSAESGGSTQESVAARAKRGKKEKRKPHRRCG